MVLPVNGDCLLRDNNTDTSTNYKVANGRLIVWSQKLIPYFYVKVHPNST